MEEKLKHLEFIQTVIARFNNNSFLVKGWSVTVSTALFVLSSKDADKSYILICFFSIPAFWLMDGYYLAVERKFRALFNEIRLEQKTDFRMDIGKIMFSDMALSLTSGTILAFHLVLIILVCFFIIKTGV